MDLTAVVLSVNLSVILEIIYQVRYVAMIPGVERFEIAKQWHHGLYCRPFRFTQNFASLLIENVFHETLKCSHICSSFD